MAKTSILLAAACAVLSGCTQGLWDWVPGIYRINIQQGNAITQEMVSQLQPGMSKRQVAYVMGTPLIQDAFHKNRWDYIYTLEANGEPRSIKRFALYFDKDHLAGVEGDFRPSNTPPPPTDNHSSVVLPPRELDDSWWGRLNQWIRE